MEFHFALEHHWLRRPSTSTRRSRINSRTADLSIGRGAAADSSTNTMADPQAGRCGTERFASRLSRFLKIPRGHDEHGRTARRLRLLGHLSQYVLPRRNFDGLAQAELASSCNSDDADTASTTMNSAQTSAVQEGERPARSGAKPRLSAKVLPPPPLSKRCPAYLFIIPDVDVGRVKPLRAPRQCQTNAGPSTRRCPITLSSEMSALLGKRHVAFSRSPLWP